MTKVLIINGSARKNGNTAQLCQKAAEGARAAGAEAEVIHLCEKPFKGCISCFGCHLNQSVDKYECFYHDELSPILEKSLAADVIIIGSPIYYGYVTGMVRSYMERLLFPLDTYHFDENGKREVKRGKHVPTALIYTMNATEEQLKHYHMDERISNNEAALADIFQEPCEHLYSCDTLQWNNYNRYYNNMFDPKEKQEHHDHQFPIDLENAFSLGRRLVERAEK